MLNYLLKFDLQLFGEGGDGGNGGSASATGEAAGGTSGENIPAHIPERAKKNYQKALEKNAQAKPAEQSQATNETNATEKLSYEDLIKSDDYKDEHKAYMNKTIGDRLKHFKGLEDSYGKAKATLDIVANKYGVNPDDENFLEVLTQKIEEDDSYFENYALEHDISTEDARKIVTMERKLAKMESQKAEMEKQEKIRQQIMMLNQNAEKTKKQFPTFDLETEMQNEKFRRLCAANNGDTTSAYMACHWNEIIPAQVQMAARQVQEQTAKAVASNKSRPIENGMSNVAPSVAENNFANMSLAELRAYAAEQRRRGR